VLLIKIILSIIGVSSYKPPKSIIDNIVDYMCKRYEVSKKELLGKKRTLDIVRARNIIHNILNENTNDYQYW